MDLSLKRDFDFDFVSDRTNRFVSFILGFLMYSVTLAIMSCFFTYNLTSDWSDALNGHITIEIQSSFDGDYDVFTDKQMDEIVKIVRSTGGIKSIKKLQESDILRILEPWLSGTSIPDDFPFPTIFDVESDRNTPIDLLLLTEKLSKISPGVKIHDHANWYAPIMKISKGLFSFAILLSVLIFATVCATVIFITKKTLSIHENIVKILQLIGADSYYIASQFNKYYFTIGCKAAVISTLMGIATIFAILSISSCGIDPSTIIYLGIVALIPLLTIALIMLTARKSVMFFLNNDGWVA